MKGNQAVIDELNAALNSELGAIVQYMVQAEMCDNWGYERLGAITKKRAIEEMKHAEGLIERILYLDGIPGVNVELKPKIGANVEEQLKFALQDEVDTTKQYNDSVAICTKVADAGSRDLFEKMIHDEERHTDFLEAQLSAINDVGIANYLSEQLTKD